MNATATHAPAPSSSAAAVSLTIASGVITLPPGLPDWALITIDAQGAAADVYAISVGRLAQIVILQVADRAGVPTIRNNVGNIRCAGDMALGPADTITLIAVPGEEWCEISRARNAQGRRHAH